jgi:hypothetical protein
MLQQSYDWHSTLGLTIFGAILIGAAIGAAIAIGLILLYKLLTAKPAPPSVLKRIEFSANWVSPPPSVLSSSGATITYKVQERTDTLTNGLVTEAGPWKDVEGASITFSLAVTSASLSGGSKRNVLTVTVKTEADGTASAELAPQSSQPNELRVHVRTPSGEEADDLPIKFEIIP